MPVVNIPNVGSINFPDSMSSEDITKAIETDILKSTPKQEGGLLKKFVSGAASVGDVVAGAPAFIAGTLGAPLVSTYQGLVEGKSPKEAAVEGRKFAEEVGASKWASPFKSALQGAGYLDQQAYENEALRQGLGMVGEGVAAGGEKIEQVTGGAIPKEQVQMIADLALLKGLPSAGKVGRAIKEKLTEPTSADIAAARPKEPVIKPTDKDVVDFAAQREFKTQPELALEGGGQTDIAVAPEANRGMYGVRPEDLTLDENGIPIKRAATEEAYMTERGGDLFSPFNLKREEVRRNVNEWEQPSIPSTEYLKQQEIEQAYAQKALQERAPVKEEPVAEPSQRGQGYQPELQEINPDTGIPSSTTDIKPARPMAEPKIKPAVKVEDTGVEVAQPPVEKVAPSEQAIVAETQKVETFEQYKDKIQQNFPDATPQDIKAGWDARESRTQNDRAVAALSNIPGLDKELSTYRTVPREEAIGYIKNSPDAESATLGFTTNQLKTRGRLGIEKIKNDGVRLGVAHLVGLRDEAGIRTNKILQGDNGISRNLRKLETLFGEGKAGEVLRQMQEAQFKPDYQFNLTPEQMKVKEQINKLFESTRQEMEQITGKPVKEIPNYFPSMFYGPFAVELRDANGRLVGFLTENSKPEAIRAAKQVTADLAAKGESVVASEPKYRKELSSEAFRNRGGLAPYFETMMDLLGSDDPLVQRAQESVQNLVAKRAMDTRKFSQRFEHKAGVLGAEGEKTWKSSKQNYRDAKAVLENYVRAFEDWKANKETASFLNEVKEDGTAPNTYNILQNYFDDLSGSHGAIDKFSNELATSLANKTGHDISGIASKTARETAGFMTKTWLGFWSPVAMAQNVLQPVNVIPKLVELASMGGSKDIISPVIIGMARSLKDIGSLTSDKLIGKGLTDSARYMKEQEVIKPGLVEGASGTKAGHYTEKGVVSGGLLATEAFARATSYNIFKAYIEKSGYTEAQARDLAKNLTHDYMVNYEQYAKPGMLTKGGVIGELAGRLQSYKFNQFTQLANYIETAKRTKNPSAAMTSIAVSIAMAGVAGMIGMDIAEGLYGLAVNTGLVDPDTKSPRQMAMDLGGATALGIPTEVTGKYLSGSLTTNLVGDMSWRNLAPVIFGTADVLAELPNVAKTVYQQFTDKDIIPKSEQAAALMKVTPASMRGMIEQKFLADESGKMVSPYTGKTTYVQGPQDEGVLSKFTNMRSRERGETSARSVLAQAQEKRITAERTKVTDKLQKFVDESNRTGKPLNPETIGKAMNRIIELEGNPENTINSIIKFVQNNQLGDWFDQQIKGGDVTMTNVYKKLRAIEQKQLIGK